MSVQSSRVVIVGAGPAGMALAYLLARRGAAVTVLESHHDFARVFRGEGIQRSGIDAFRQMGLGEQFDRVPHTEVRTIEIYSNGRLVVRADPAGLGRGQARLVSQPALLEMLADESGKYPAFRLDRGVTMRDFLRENGRVVGVRASAEDGPREYRADLVVGADGRNAATRKHSGFPELSAPQDFDILWIKVPYPDSFPDRATGVLETSPNRVALRLPHGRWPAPDRLRDCQGRLRRPSQPRRGGVDRRANRSIAGLPCRSPARHREAVAGAVLLERGLRPAHGVDHAWPPA